MTSLLLDIGAKVGVEVAFHLLPAIAPAVNHWVRTLIAACCISAALLLIDIGNRFGPKKGREAG